MSPGVMGSAENAGSEFGRRIRDVSATGVGSTNADRYSESVQVSQAQSAITESGATLVSSNGSSGQEPASG